MKKMDIHIWKDGKLNEMLMEKFGYKKKKDPELLKEGFGEGKPAKGKWSKKKVYSEEEELEERRRTSDRMAGRPKGSGREKVSEAEDPSVGGIPHVPPGDYEGMAHAAIAAIVQLAEEAGVVIDLTTGPEADLEDAREPLDTAEDPSASAEAGEEELLSIEDL